MRADGLKNNHSLLPELQARFFDLVLHRLRFAELLKSSYILLSANFQTL